MNAPICKTPEYATISGSKGVNPTYFEWRAFRPTAHPLGECVICLEAQAASVLLPCAHRCVCEEDAKVCGLSRAGRRYRAAPNGNE